MTKGRDFTSTYIQHGTNGIPEKVALQHSTWEQVQRTYRHCLHDNFQVTWTNWGVNIYSTSGGLEEYSHIKMNFKLPFPCQCTTRLPSGTSFCGSSTPKRRHRVCVCIRIWLLLMRIHQATWTFVGFFENKIESCFSNSETPAGFIAELTWTKWDSLRWAWRQWRRSSSMTSRKNAKINWRIGPSFGYFWWNELRSKFRLLQTSNFTFDFAGNFERSGI